MHYHKRPLCLFLFLFVLLAVLFTHIEPGYTSSAISTYKTAANTLPQLFRNIGAVVAFLGGMLFAVAKFFGG